MELIYTSAKDIEGLYKVLADESRLKVLFLLSEVGEACVQDIQLVLRVPQPTVSRHLGYLKRMGLVENNRKGKWNYYHIAKHQPEIVRHHLALLKAPAYRKILMPAIQSALDRLGARSRSRR